MTKMLAEDWKSFDGTWCGSVEQAPIDLFNSDEFDQYEKMPSGFAPSFNLPTVDGATANHNGKNVNLDFQTDSGSTFPYPSGGTFTSLSGDYTGDLPGVPEGSTNKSEYGEGDDDTAAYAQGTLIDLHWHVPSEHAVAGQLYDAEGHFVHIVDRPNDPDCTYMSGDNGPYCLAVIGVLYTVYSDQAAQELASGFDDMLSKLADNNLPDYQDPETAPINNIDFNEFLPSSKEFVHYRGSLTTPGCNENVTWYVLEEPVPMGWSHYAELRESILHDGLGDLNARPPLPLNERPVFVSDYNEAKKKYGKK
eukprot:scaffold12235_cov37-Prasinocladus_malaysianus.AAC.1